MSVSGTSHTSQSAFTITDSFKERLVEMKDGHLFSAVAEHYHLPFDESVRGCENIVHQFSQLLNDGDDTCITEPPEHNGEIKRMLEKGGGVLDIGCGMQGVWVVQMCEAYPEIEAFGIALIPVERNFSPPNASFEVSDFVDEGCLLYPSEYFDVVHCRYTLPWLNPLKNTFNLNEIRRVLKPGGVFLLEEAILTGPHNELIHPSWLHREQPDGRWLWPAIFRLLGLLIRSSGRDGSEDGHGWFDEVVELNKRVHVGRQTTRSASDSDDSLQQRQAPLHTILEDQFLTPTKGDLIDELDHPRLPDPTLLPKIDSGLWQEYTLIWARKTEGEQTSA